MNDPAKGFRQAAPEPEFGLAEAQRRMQRQLMASTGVAQSVFDLAKQELTWNPRAHEIFGVDAAQTPLTLDFAMGLVYPDDLDMLIRAREQLRRSPGAIELDYRIIRPVGELVEIHSAWMSPNASAWKMH
jgi:PAS domain-containing protein